MLTFRHLYIDKILLVNYKKHVVRQRFTLKLLHSIPWRQERLACKHPSLSIVNCSSFWIVFSFSFKSFSSICKSFVVRAVISAWDSVDSSDSMRQCWAQHCRDPWPWPPWPWTRVLDTWQWHCTHEHWHWSLAHVTGWTHWRGDLASCSRLRPAFQQSTRRNLKMSRFETSVKLCGGAYTWQVWKILCQLWDVSGDRAESWWHGGQCGDHCPVHWPQCPVKHQVSSVSMDRSQAPDQEQDLDGLRQPAGVPPGQCQLRHQGEWQYHPALGPSYTQM